MLAGRLHQRPAPKKAAILQLGHVLRRNLLPGLWNLLSRMLQQHLLRLLRFGIRAFDGQFMHSRCDMRLKPVPKRQHLHRLRHKVHLLHQRLCLHRMRLWPSPPRRTVHPELCRRPDLRLRQRHLRHLHSQLPDLRLHHHLLHLQRRLPEDDQRDSVRDLYEQPVLRRQHRLRELPRLVFDVQRVGQQPVHRLLGSSGAVGRELRGVHRRHLLRRGELSAVWSQLQHLHLGERLHCLCRLLPTDQRGLLRPVHLEPVLHSSLRLSKLQFLMFDLYWWSHQPVLNV